MSEEPQPVRAWAEWDTWSAFCLYQPTAEVWDLWLTPKSAEGEPWCVSIHTDLADALPETPGPLRSLRVLLSTGHEVSMDCCVEDGYCIDGTFTWELRDGQQWPCGGSITDLSDADAVARAISEAVAWVSGHEGVKA